MQSSERAVPAFRRQRSTGILGAILCLVTACASLPTGYPPPSHSETLAPDATTALGQLAAKFTEAHGPGVSGFAAVDTNRDGLSWRLAMADSAERSLDMLYYLWYGDDGGLLLLEHVIDAAERGVRVRIVVDDVLFVKGKKRLADLDAHPNIEIRIFNPWASRGVGRAFESVGRVKKLNHRMHNKLLIADSQMAILGGRNIGDHYFGLNHKYNFHDLDLIVLGDDAMEPARIFDHFWDSDRVVPASAFVDHPSWKRVERARREEVVRLKGHPDLSAFLVERRDWGDELAGLVDLAAPGTAVATFDLVLPDSRAPTRDTALRLAEIARQARREILIVNAYVIPGVTMMEILHEATERGVRIRVLTNSLASNDVPAVTAKYKKYRKPLLDAGVELYEFAAHPEIQPGIIDTAPVAAKFAGLHTKAAVFDDRIVYIGSLNLDPRSVELNTEMGMIVSSTGLAEEVAAIAERDMGPANSWQVHLDDNGELYWVSSEGTVHRQPAQNSWQRIQMWFFGILPESQL